VRKRTAAGASGGLFAFLFLFFHNTNLSSIRWIEEADLLKPVPLTGGHLGSMALVILH